MLRSLEMKFPGVVQMFSPPIVPRSELRCAPESSYRVFLPGDNNGYVVH